MLVENFEKKNVFWVFERFDDQKLDKKLFQ